MKLLSYTHQGREGWGALDASGQGVVDLGRRLSAIADGAGIPLAELSLRWLLGSADVAALLLGGSRVSQLVQTVAGAGAGPLPADVVAACDEVGATLRGPMPAYNR